MKLYSETTDFKLYEGSMLDMLQVLNPCTVDSVVTDPPYELGFMGKGWDSSGIAFQADTWRKCFSVLKSGGYLLAFGGSRTYHRIACAIEDAGFEIRDCIMWLYGSGFPKSMNIGLAIDKKNGVESIITGYTDQQDIRGGNYCNNQEKRLMHPVRQAQNEWDGWGTALKPAYEPIIVARKPCEGSCVDNVMRHGVGGINIDGCRIATNDKWQRKEQETNAAEGYQRKNENGRYPSNVILTYDETDRKEVCGGMPETKSVGGEITNAKFGGGTIGVCNFGCVGAKRISTGYIAPARR